MSLDILTNLQQIGGSSCPVFKATHKILGQVALKLFPYEDKFYKLYLYERDALAKLNHKDIVRYLGSIDEYNIPTLGKKYAIIIMEFCPYPNLMEIVHSNGHLMSEPFIRTIFHSLVEGVEHMHEQGVAHLDIKLANILIGANHTVKIADFDLAQYHSESSLRSAGTHSWRAPEVANGTAKNFEAADIYSLGMVLLSLFYGKFLFKEEVDERGYAYFTSFYYLLQNNPIEFWEICARDEELRKASDSFRILLTSMLKAKFEDRATLKEIKESEWYRGEVLEEEEVIKLMRKLVNVEVVNDDAAFGAGEISMIKQELENGEEDFNAGTLKHLGLDL